MKNLNSFLTKSLSFLCLLILLNNTSFCCNQVIITTQPQNASACSNNSATFTVTTTGDPTISYQWQVNPAWNNLIDNTLYSGVTTQTLTVTNPIATSQYRCIISYCAAPSIYLTSDAATLTLDEPVQINSIFHSQTQCFFDSVGFTLSPTSGTGPFSYQWLLNGKPVTDGSGGTSSFFYNNGISSVDAGTYSCVISNACGPVTGNVVNLILSTCNPTQHILSGYVTYDNKAQTPMSSKTAYTKTYVYLYNEVDTIIDSCQTDDNGFYVFVNLINGNYWVSGSTIKPLEGVNPIDALIINRCYINLTTISDTLWKAAGDVNANGKLDPLDALLVNRRYINLISKYPKVPDWLFEKIPVEVAGVNVQQDIKAECYGDVNGSYTPPK